MHILLAIALASNPIIQFLVAVIIALIVLYGLGLIFKNSDIMLVIRLTVGVVVLLYGLQLFGIVG